MKILHFADAHIDIAAHGRHDNTSGLPLRVLDFLTALDTIIEAAIQERVDLVIFAGDAYKDRTPSPTYQREWGKRIMRLSQARIPTLLIVGNHDLSPAQGRANALQEYETLQVPYIHVAGKPQFFRSGELDGLPVQIIALPWVSRSGLLARTQQESAAAADVNAVLETRLGDLVGQWLEEADPNTITLLAAHTSVQGAVYGGERSVMLGGDLTLPGSVVRDARLDYVALGHIHKAQNLNERAHPPVIYPGSIERVDFGEAQDDKFYVIAQVERGSTQVEWRKLNGRRFIDRFVKPRSAHTLQSELLAALPDEADLEGAVVRLVVEYPRAWESALDEKELRTRAANAFEFHFIRRPQMEARLRLPEDRTISSLTPLEVLNLYWQTNNTSADDIPVLQQAAENLLRESDDSIQPLSGGKDIS
mgnify:CR=1 FL=1